MQVTSAEFHIAYDESLKIFKLYLSVQNDQKKVEELQKLLLATPLAPSFAKQVFGQMNPDLV